MTAFSAPSPPWRSPCARAYTRPNPSRLSHARKRVVSGSIAQRAQLLIVDPDVGDHEVEARLPPPDQRDRAFIRIAESGTPTPRRERLRRRREPRSGWRGTHRKGESGPAQVAGTDVRAVTHPAVVTADDQGNPLG